MVCFAADESGVVDSIRVHSGSARLYSDLHGPANLRRHRQPKGEQAEEGLEKT